MSTSAQHQERTASSEGTEAHNLKAKIRNNITYFVKVHGMSQDAAKAKVNAMPESDLMSSEECNRAIARHAQQAQRDAERAHREAEAEARRKAEREAQAEREAKQAEQKAKAKAKVEPESCALKHEHEQLIVMMLKASCGKVALKAMLKSLGYTEAQVLHLMSVYMPEAEKTRSESLDYRFDAYCAEKFRTIDELNEFIDEIGSPNFKKFRAHLLARGAMFNKVHQKYM